MASRETASLVKAYVHLVRTAEALHAAVSRGLMVEGLTASQFSTIKALRFHGPLAQRDIAKHILKSGGNITMVVDNLERTGLVVRERDHEDRRIIYVRLTPDGEQLFDRIYPAHLKRIEDAMKTLGVDGCDHLVELLEQLDHQEIVVGGSPVAANSAASTH